MIQRSDITHGSKVCRSIWQEFRRSIPSALLVSALFTPQVFAAELIAQSTAESRDMYAQIAPYQPRFERVRPLIAVVGENAGTELSDFMIPFGILSQSGVADVHAVTTQEGTLQFRPALRIQSPATTESFDRRFPYGADYVIVPAVSPENKAGNPTLIRWIQAQADKGAILVSICDGALIVAKAGLFKGRHATGHWASQSEREHDFPDTQWMTNTRYVADGKVISSAGVTAAIPLSLALIEAIAGTEQATRVAKEIGVTEWSSRHNSDVFHFSFGLYFTAARNWLWPSQAIGLPITAGVDEIALALTADAFSRTFRSQAFTVANTANGVPTRHGLTLLPDRVKGDTNAPKHMHPAFNTAPSVLSLDQSLADIAHLFGKNTANFVATQLEYFSSTRSAP